MIVIRKFFAWFLLCAQFFLGEYASCVRVRKWTATAFAQKLKNTVNGNIINMHIISKHHKTMNKTLDFFSFFSVFWKNRHQTDDLTKCVKLLTDWQSISCDISSFCLDVECCCDYLWSKWHIQLFFLPLMLNEPTLVQVERQQSIVPKRSVISKNISF